MFHLTYFLFFNILSMMPILLLFWQCILHGDIWCLLVLGMFLLFLYFFYYFFFIGLLATWPHVCSSHHWVNRLTDQIHRRFLFFPKWFRFIVPLQELNPSLWVHNPITVRFVKHILVKLTVLAVTHAYFVVFPQRFGGMCCSITEERELWYYYVHT